MPLNFAFSPCPNDTFAFHAAVHRLVPGPDFTPHLDDIEALNIRAATAAAEVTKVSIAAYGHGLSDRLILLRAGGAAGFGVGPIVVAKQPRPIGGRVAIPGERTTAALLLRQLGRFNTVVMRFDQIEDAVLRGDVDCGVLIHEGRFTYEARGLTLIEDLGSVWEERMRAPLPLAAIAIRRDLAHLAPQVDAALKASVEYAFANPSESADYVAAHAQEMGPGVTRRHIELYVNDYTVALDATAVMGMLEWGEREGFFPPVDKSLPIFA
ncbi:MAG: 1,4-dihydroxy-6-naphthoate synthase [Cyanobacteria bacterium]|nr:1,4-dihydroxy-6-naphthoate synthase [Cyanobacteriota bacterium]